MIVIEINSIQSKIINSMIKRLCSNCVCGCYCLLLDDSCVQLISSQGLYCNYFKKYILPLESDLYIELMNAQGQTKRCEMCNNLYVPKGKKQKYCDSCKKKRHLDASKKYLHDKRHSVDNLE